MFEREWESKREEHVESEAPARQRPREIIQAKLTVGAANDPFEREADRVADSVMRALGRAGAAAEVPATDGLDPMSISRHAGHAGHDHAPPEVGYGGGSISDELSTRIRSSAGGRPLDDGVRTRMEHGFGADFSSVRIHANSALPATIAADAFTVGRSIHFAEGRYDPSSSAGQHLLAHELTHVVQQGGAPAQRHVCDSACGHEAATGESAQSVSHELTHAIQHGGVAAVARYSCGSTDEHVQRHSSFEHLMLGNVRPEDLAKIGAWEDAIQQTKAKRTGLAKKVRGAGRGGGEDEASFDITLGGQQLQFSKTDILHVLLQEMLRLRKWQRDVPDESSAEQTNQQNAPLANVGKDPTFDVVTVRLPQGMLCTYGEMNTLADYFGSVEVLRTARRPQVKQLLQSVRDETWMFLSKAFYKLAASLTEDELESEDMATLHKTWVDEILVPEGLEGDETTFKGATAARISGMLGQIELLTGIQGTGARGETNEYGASLGRNACHFVPESWHAWANNHKKAREVALVANDARTRANNCSNAIPNAPDQEARATLQETCEFWKQRSAEKANEALMTNGFGDHYLQDSYAAGHMINKTQIMQFYIEFIDQNKEWDYFKDENWRKVQNIAYGQELAPPTQYTQNLVQGYDKAANAPAPNKGIDPQSVENRGDGNWETNFRELGLQVPPSLRTAGSTTRRIVDRLQFLARIGQNSANGHEIQDFIKLPLRDVRLAVGDLVADGVLLPVSGGTFRYADVDVSKRGQMMAGMRDGEELEANKFTKARFRLRDELKPKKGSAVPQDMSEGAQQERFKAVTYNDYIEFITSAFLQKSTNALHDTFCKNGLTVYDRGATEIGRVYGDDAMFSANSSVGVAHSGTTSQMSRDAILNIINTGNDGGTTEQAIVNRFPRKVRADIYNDKGKVVTAGQPMDIEVWHNTANAGGLKSEAFRWIFPSMAWGITQKMVPGAKGGLGEFFTAPAPHNPF